MNNKVISVNKKLTNLFDKLAEKEELLAQYIHLSQTPIMARPISIMILGFLMNPITTTVEGAKRAEKNIESNLRNLYKQNPIAYIRFSGNIPILQRIMVLEQATTLQTINDITKKQRVYFLLNVKLKQLNIPFTEFLKPISDLNRNMANELNSLWNAEKTD